MVPYNMATYSQKRYSCCVDSKICRTQRAFHVTTMKDIGWKQFGVESSWKMVTWNTDMKEDERNWIRITSNGGVEPSHSATTEQVGSHMMLGQE